LNLPGRTIRQCRDRWDRYLSQCLKRCHGRQRRICFSGAKWQSRVGHGNKWHRFS
jgi:hypothetical protein